MVKFLSLIVSILAIICPLQSLADERTAETTSGAKASLYGFVRLDMIFNDARLDNPQFPNYVAPRAEGEGKENEFLMHPRLSRLGLDISGERMNGGVELEGKIEVDFQNGGSESRSLIRMRHAYGKLHAHGFYALFGQTWQLVSQIFPSVNGDSLMWNTGNAGDRAPQLRGGYQGNVGPGKIDAAVAAVMPNAVDRKDLDADGTFDGQNAAMPAIHGRVAFGMPTWTNAPLAVALGGLFARESVDDDVTGLDETFESLGLFVELEVPIIDMLAVRGEAFFGQNLSDVRGGIGQGVNLAQATEVSTMGFWGEAKVSPTPRLTFAAGYGQDDPDDGDLDDGARALNRALWVGAGVKPSSRTQVGLEFIHWITESKGSDMTYNANRLNFYLSYGF